LILLQNDWRDEEDAIDRRKADEENRLLELVSGSSFSNWFEIYCDLLSIHLHKLKV
jgi:hypothetical protein